MKTSLIIRNLIKYTLGLPILIVGTFILCLGKTVEVCLNFIEWIIHGKNSLYIKSYAEEYLINLWKPFTE